MQRQVGSIFRIVGDPVNHRGREKIDGKLGLLLSVEGALDPGSSRFVYASLLIDGEVVSYYFYESELELIGCTGV
jgi:hypothetical protein